MIGTFDLATGETYCEACHLDRWLAQPSLRHHPTRQLDTHTVGRLERDVREAAMWDIPCIGLGDIEDVDTLVELFSAVFCGNCGVRIDGEHAVQA